MKFEPQFWKFNDSNLNHKVFKMKDFTFGFGNFVIYPTENLLENICTLY